LSMYLAFSLIDLKLSTYFKRFRFTALALLVVLFLGIGLLTGLESFTLHPLIITGIVTIISLSVYIIILYLLDSTMRRLLIDSWVWLTNQFRQFNLSGHSGKGNCL